MFAWLYFAESLANDQSFWKNPANLTPAMTRKLKALGFLPTAELKPKRLVLGTLPVEKLDLLIGLPFVGYVDVPKFLDEVAG